MLKLKVQTTYLLVSLHLILLLPEISTCLKLNSTGLNDLDHLQTNSSIDQVDPDTNSIAQKRFYVELGNLNYINYVTIFFVIDKNFNIIIIYILGKDLFIVLSPILLGLGGIGNFLCIIVLFRKSKNNPTIMYFVLLAVFDVLVLHTGLLRNYLIKLLNFDIRSYSSFNCKVHVFLTYTFMDISAYILVAVTLNRFTIMFNRTLFCKQVYNTKKRYEY